jgi:hypothetical protein
MIRIEIMIAGRDTRSGIYNGTFFCLSGYVRERFKTEAEKRILKI